MPRKWKDWVAATVMSAAAAICLALVFAVALGLLQKSRPILATKPLSHLLFSSSWHPLRGEFGLYPFLLGTLWVSGLAMALSVPVCLLTAIYLAEYAGRRVRALAQPLMDLLAGIPPVVFGLWGMLAVVPFVGKVGTQFGSSSMGYSVLAGGIVLAIMVSPIMIAVAQEVLRSVPLATREASLALGASKWQTVKHVTLRSVVPGLAAAVVLGFSRALGETMAVLMVVGNVPKPPHSVFDPAYPLPALIANNYGEMMSIPLYDSALLLAALVLLTLVLTFNLATAVMLRGATRAAVR
jgi:phosphate transport system permease protein